MYKLTTICWGQVSPRPRDKPISNARRCTFPANVKVGF